MGKENKPLEDEELEPHDESETDWKAEARKWEARARKNSSAAKKLQELEDESKSELQKALERAEKAESKAKALENAHKVQALKSNLAQEFGVPSELIPDLEEDAMRSFAERLSEFRKPTSAPKVPKNGSFKDDALDDDPRREIAKQLFGTHESE